MAEYINLVGAEDVRHAASRMAYAAEEMSRAASKISSVFEQHQRFMDDWLQRFDGLLQDRISDMGITLR